MPRKYDAATRDTRAPVAGTVTLVITPTPAPRVVPELLALWRTHTPGIRVRLLMGDDVEVATWLGTGAIRDRTTP